MKREDIPGWAVSLVIKRHAEQAERFAVARESQDRPLWSSIARQPDGEIYARVGNLCYRVVPDGLELVDRLPASMGEQLRPQRR